MRGQVFPFDGCRVDGEKKCAAVDWCAAVDPSPVDLRVWVGAVDACCVF